MKNMRYGQHVHSSNTQPALCAGLFAAGGLPGGGQGQIAHARQPHFGSRAGSGALPAAGFGLCADRGPCIGAGLHLAAARALHPQTAQHSLGEVLGLGYRQAGGVKENFFDGSMALAGVVGKELTVHEIWALKEVCNSYFGLSL